MLFCFMSLTTSYFAGDGIMTYAYTMNGQEDTMSCYTNDGCYMLLCYFLSDPSYVLLVIQPNPFVGSCDQINTNDGRVLNAMFVTYINNTYDNTYTVPNVSYASQLLCQLGQNKSIDEIDYINQCM